MKKAEIYAKLEILANEIGTNEAMEIFYHCSLISLKVGLLKALERLEALKANLQPKTVTLYAFTGMKLGEFGTYTEHPDRIELTIKNGKVLVFDKSSGRQLNANNPKFGNKIKLD